MQHTLGHRDCPACEAARKDVLHSADFAQLPFDQAAPLWLASRAPKLAPRSVDNYRQYIRSLGKFFAGMALASIHIGHVNAYQASRRARAGASRINHELSCLGQVMARAGLWAEIARFYEPLPLPRTSVGIALSAEEERHLLEVARSRKRWMVAYCCGLLSRNTTASPSEIQHLRLCSLDLPQRLLYIEEGTKNGHRVRTLPLNDDALWAAEWLLARAAALGATQPQHFLLPHRAHRRGAPPDTARPMGSWKKAHYAMRMEAAKRFPRLAAMRRYDWRHTAATVMLEDPSISFRTIETMMGHRLGSRTKERYSHLRDQALRSAAQALDSRATAPRKPPRPQLVQKPASSGEGA